MKVTKNKRVGALAALLCAYSAGFEMPAEARGEHNDRPRGLGRINLDLNSTDATVNFSRRLAETVSIRVGDQMQTINAGQMLTPAEAIAAYQVMRGQEQSIILGADGNAVGGNFQINTTLQKHVRDISIPANVTVINDIARNGTLRLNGDLNNAGNFYAVSTDQSMDTARVIAQNIFNNATISTVIPEGGLAGVSNANQNLNLSLTALNDVVNAGTISSSGNLEVVAGRSIINSAAQGLAGPAIMQAANNVNLTAANLVNAGTIAAQVGNINLAGQVAADATSGFNQLNIDARGGQFQALNGSINIGSSLGGIDGGLAGADSNVTAIGGDWFSKELNITAGGGEITASLGKVTGTLNSSSAMAHINADTDVLTIGNNCVTGDPTFANTGDIIINGDVTVNEALAIIAGGDILVNGAGSITNTSSAATYLVAGAHITSGGTAGDGTLPPGSAAVGSVVFSFDNTAGGNIDFTQTAINPVVTTNGGSLTLLANSNGAGTGNVWTRSDAGSIVTDGTTSGGSVTIVAGGAGGITASGETITDAVRIYEINTSSSGGDGGSVSIKSAAPTITSGPTATFLVNGTTTATFGSGSISAGGVNIVSQIQTSGADGTNAVGDGAVGVDGKNAGSVTIVSGGALNVDTLDAQGGRGGAGGDSVFGTGGAGGNGGLGAAVSLTSQTLLTVDRTYVSGGTGGAGGQASNGVAGGAGGSGGAAGSVSFSSILGGFTGSNIEAVGGSGGNGGNSNNNHGSGGAGAAGGVVAIEVLSDLTFGGYITASGGDGGNGTGNGADGTGGTGAVSGNILLSTDAGDIGTAALPSGNIIANGGAGGDGTAGGAGANSGLVTISSGGGVYVGSLSASGGSASTSETAGQGGIISITAVDDIGTSSTPLGFTTVDGGAGRGSSGSNGADAGMITIDGSANVYLGFLNASGGFSNSDVIGGGGGSISATADGALQFFGATANGGDGGSNSAWGGNGGTIDLTGSTINDTTIVSGVSARGGNAGISPDGAGGSGGYGGAVTVNSTNQTAIFLIDTRGGSGGTGADASGSTSSGYNGGLGGLGGQVLINAGSLNLDSINTSGGSGGAGGSGNFSIGGSGGVGGVGGGSGIITLTVTDGVEIDAITARGGAGGSGGISGISFGSGGAGGAGGMSSDVSITGNLVELGNLLMNGGNGGAGGSGTTNGTNGALGGAAGGAGDLTVSSTSLVISFAALNGGVGGAGGASGQPDSSGGNGGVGGSGGLFDLTTTGNIEFGDVRADGGAGGSGGSSGNNSGSAGMGGSGGAAGSFDLTAAVLSYDYISATGANGGAGGNAGALNSGSGGNGGNGTNGGTVLVAGSISPGSSSSIALNGGNGGAGGLAGAGSAGTSGSNGQFGTITAEGAFLGTINSYIETNAGTITMRGDNGVFVRATNPNVLISGLNSGDTYRVESPFGSITVADVPVTSDLRLIANNTINFSGTSTVSVLNVVPGAGGTLVLNAQDYAWLNQGAAPLVLQANGTASGGFIDFTQVANDINVGTAAGQIQFEAQGGNGGALSVFAINGNINLADIANGIQVSPTDVNGSGASLTLTAGNLIYGGTLPLTFNQANGNGTGNGGDITIDLRNVSTDITLGSSGQYILEATGANGGSVGFLTNGNLIIDGDGFNVAPTSANGNVGSVGFTGALVQGEGGGKLVLDLSAGPASTGNAGNIFVRQTAATGTTIGTGASDDFQFAATAAIGNGGSISFITSGDLTVDPAALSTLSFNKKGGNSGSIFLKAGDDVSTGVLIINGDLSTASKKGTAGNITLESDSAIPFNYGGSAFSGNGFNGGSASVSGSTNGALAIVNSGDVNINESITAAKQIALTSDSGALNINASLGGKDTDSISLSGNQVVTGSTKVKYTGGTLAVSSSDDFTGPGGAAIQTSIQNLTLSVAGDASISNKLALAVNTSMVGGNLTIASKGAIETANQSDVVTANTLTLSTKKTVGFDHAFGISALQLSLQGLKGNSNIHSTRAVELLDSSFGGSLVFDSDDSINISGAFGSSKAAITLQANFGSIATQGNGVIIADIATLHADSTNATLGTAGSINALKLDASTINATADGLINVFDVASTVTVERAETQNGNLTIATGPDSKALVVPGVVVARNGAVNLQNQNATKGTIKIASGADISTQGGGGGAVSIFIGAAPPAMVAGTAPAGVTINQLGVTGDVLFGTNGITANTKNGDNVLNLKNANIIFSTGALSAKAIVLDGNTTILADPPNPEGFVPMSFATPNFNSQSVDAPSDSGMARNSGSPLTLSSTGSEQALPNSISSLALPSTVSSLVLSNTVSPLTLSSTVGGSTASGAPINIIETSSFSNSLTKSSLVTNQATSSDQPSAAHLSMAMAAIAGAGAGFESGAFDALVLADHDRSLAGQFNTAAQITDGETTPNGTKRLTLHRGNLVVAQNVATSVETKYGTVSIDAKSVVLLMATGNSLAVYNVDDHRKGAVKVENGNRTIMLSPGNHAVLTSAKVSSFDAINPAECFTYRNLNFAESANGLKTFTGEFSIPAALHVVKPLKHLVKTHCDSADASKESRAIVDHLMKTTAVLLHMQGAGRFEQYVRPRVAAYAPLTSN